MTDITVKSEPRTYEPGSGNSFYLDASALTRTNGDSVSARKRMYRYGKELSVEIDRGSEEGKRALRIINQAHRNDDKRTQEQDVQYELRAMSSGAGTGGEFVTPIYLMSGWSPALDIEPVLANQCNNATLPDYGMKVYVPTFSSGTSVTVTAEGSQINLDSPEPVTAYQSAVVQTASTAVTISQQLGDRGRDLVSFDQALSEQIQLNLNAELDSLTLSAISATAQSTATVGTASAGALWADVAGARERAYAANTRARATHLFTSEKVYGWASKILDNQARPILEAHHMPDTPPWGLSGVRDDDKQWSGFTGTIMPGGLLWFIDENVTGELLVSRPAATIVATADPVFQVVPSGSLVPNLQLLARTYQYVAVIPRIPYSSQIITGYGTAS